MAEELVTLEPSRLEPQYLQAATAFWTNINTLIWQKLVIILLLQTSGLVGAYSLRGSVAGALLVALVWALSVMLLSAVYADMITRDKLIAQLNFLCHEAMSRYLKNKSLPTGLDANRFVLLDKSEDITFFHVRHITAVAGLMVMVSLFDLLALFSLHFPRFLESALSFLKLPSFPGASC